MLAWLVNGVRHLRAQGDAEDPGAATPAETAAPTETPEGTGTAETLEPVWLLEREAAAHLRVSPRTLQHWRLRGGGPPFHRPKRAGIVRYRLDELDTWLGDGHASTSSADRSAGSERAWVSLPMKSGPAIPRCARYSQMAWVVARMWASLKLSRRADPRWPLVPKLT